MANYPKSRQDVVSALPSHSPYENVLWCYQQAGHMAKVKCEDDTSREIARNARDHYDAVAEALVAGKDPLVTDEQKEKTEVTAREEPKLAAPPIHHGTRLKFGDADWYPRPSRPSASAPGFTASTNPSTYMYRHELEKLCPGVSALGIGPHEVPIPQVHQSPAGFGSISPPKAPSASLPTHRVNVRLPGASKQSNEDRTALSGGAARSEMPQSTDLSSESFRSKTSGASIWSQSLRAHESLRSATDGHKAQDKMADNSKPVEACKEVQLPAASPTTQTLDTRSTGKGKAAAPSGLPSAANRVAIPIIKPQSTKAAAVREAQSTPQISPAANAMQNSGSMPQENSKTTTALPHLRNVPASASAKTSDESSWITITPKKKTSASAGGLDKSKLQDKAPIMKFPSNSQSQRQQQRPQSVKSDLPPPKKVVRKFRLEDEFGS